MQPQTLSDDRPAIVFDFGGVLFRWHPPSMLRRVVPHLAHDEASAAHWVREIFQGYGGDWQAFDQGRVEVPDLVRRIARRTGAGEADVQAVVDAVPHELQPIEPAVALLARLKAAGRRLYFLSNMPAPYSDHLERTHGFVRWFDDGIFSARVLEAKPDRAIFEIAQRRFGRAPHELVFLDDHVPNVDAARTLGWQAIHFVDAAQAEAELKAHGLA
ncbi:MAG: HAD family phosphatase [Rubrivivax sp.]|nr:HAD family phosphatase [Rubrivivax sp.]MCA3256612.1 HAD family phosphatase [Rubrivivax sp.]MCE2913482.1 HAD family phosphatase [Rubrivivax sp.]MCZ8032453.1 HAD family phosphatase [Rubrivivax sp.]